jgi:hypothetical protein
MVGGVSVFDVKGRLLYFLAKSAQLWVVHTRRPLVAVVVIAVVVLNLWRTVRRWWGWDLHSHRRSKKAPVLSLLIVAKMAQPKNLLLLDPTTKSTLSPFFLSASKKAEPAIQSLLHRNPEGIKLKRMKFIEKKRCSCGGCSCVCMCKRSSIVQ